MVHFPGFARTRLWIHRAVRRFYPRGFPHSEISGSMPACGSPKLIAACHVLLRLLLPRHPPCALSSLTIKLTRHIPDRSRLRRENSMGLDPAHRMQHRFPSLCQRALRGFAFGLPLRALGTEKFRAAYTSRFSSGTHKNLQPCRLPNLFSCQISSSEFSLMPASASLDCFQPNVRRQATFLKP